MGGGPSTVTKPEIPEELKPLVKASVDQTMALQKRLPIDRFSEPNIQQYPGLNPMIMQLIGQEFMQAQSSPALGPQNRAVAGTVANQEALSRLGGAPAQPPWGGPISPVQGMDPRLMALLSNPGTMGSKGGSGQWPIQPGSPGGPLRTVPPAVVSAPSESAPVDNSSPVPSYPGYPGEV